MLLLKRVGTKDVGWEADFLLAWSGQSVSLLGSAVTRLALPLTAVLILGATPAQMGLLVASQTTPMLLIGLLAGVWVDRVRRRPLLIATDLGQAVLLGWIPLAAVLGLLRMEQVYVVAFLVGCLVVLSGLAGVAYLPVLVGRSRLVEANSWLTASESVAQIAGPSFAGGLVQVVSAPVAILIDCASFVVSAVALTRIRQPEPAPPPREAGQRIGPEIAEGFRLLLANPVLRALAGAAGTGNAFSAASQAVYLLFATRELGIDPALLGLILGIGSVGSLVGAVLAGPLARRFGLGQTMLGVAALYGLSSVLVPVAGGPLLVASAVLLLARLLLALANPIFNITSISLRQTLTPDHLQGRVNASARFIANAVTPLGALVGGALGETIGLRPTLLVAGVGILLAGLWIVLSPVPSIGVEQARAER
jgi:MFS family permease